MSYKFNPLSGKFDYTETVGPGTVDYMAMFTSAKEIGNGPIRRIGGNTLELGDVNITTTLLKGNAGLGITPATGVKFHIKGTTSAGADYGIRIDSQTVDKMFVVQMDGKTGIGTGADSLGSIFTTKGRYYANNAASTTEVAIHATSKYTWQIQLESGSEANLTGIRFGATDSFAGPNIAIYRVGVTNAALHSTYRGSMYFSPQGNITGFTGYTFNIYNDNTDTTGFRIVEENGSSSLGDSQRRFFLNRKGLIINGGVATLEASAAVQIDSRPGAGDPHKGFLPPRVTTVQRDSITGPVAGLIVYDSTLDKLNLYTNAWGELARITPGSIVQLFTGAAIASPAGGAFQDAEARTAINSILSRLRANGIILT